MKNWRLHRVTASLMVRITEPMPDLTAPIEAEIDAIWRMEQSRLGNVLFNGRVFSGDVITPELVTGHWTEYRRIVAQLRRPELYEHIRIRPLAVGGVIQSPGTDYTVSGSQITFTTAPVASLTCFIVALGQSINVGTPSPGTVTPSSLNLAGLGNYANDTAAASGGVAINGIYRNGSVLQIRVT